MYSKILLISLFGALICNSANADNVNILPIELVNLANKYSCDSLRGFYADKDIINPPNVYGYLPGIERDSAVFWCKKKTGIDDVRPFNYQLIFMYRREHELASCPNPVVWKSMIVGGLKVYHRLGESLSTFRYMDNNDKVSNNEAVIEHPGIYVSAGGQDVTIYCYKGRWLWRERC